jgi:hypothetical protein
LISCFNRKYNSFALFFQETFHVKKGKKITRNKEPQQKHRGETEPLKNRQGFKFSNNFEDDLDEKKEENYNRVHKTERNFGKTQRRQHDNTPSMFYKQR